MKETATLALPYRFGSADTTSADLLYRYSQRTASTNTADIVSRYSRDPDTTRYEQQKGFWAWSTQELGNILPRWHMGRLNSGGDTQKFLNTIGMGFDEIKLAYAKHKKDLFIGTADTTVPHSFYYGPVVDYDGSGLRTRGTNLLLNPSFSIRGLARSKMPANWYACASGSVELIESPTFVGTHCVSMVAESGEWTHLRQRITGEIPVGLDITASIWYMSPTDNATVAASATIAGIAMHIMYTDGRMETFREPLSIGPDNEWRRAEVTATLTKEMFSVTFSVYLDNTTDDAITLYAGAAQLEVASQASPWQEPISTPIPYIRDRVGYDSPVDAYIIKTDGSRRKLVYVDNEDTFWNGLVPTRAELESVVVVPPATNRTRLGWFTTPSDAPDTFTTSWRINGDKIEQYNYTASSEVIGSFDIGEFHLDGAENGMVGVLNDTEDPNFSRTLEALCVYKDRLWVLCKEVSSKGTFRVIKVLNPHSQWVLPIAYDQGLSMYLECVGDFSLSVTSGTADYIGYVEQEPDKLLVKIDDTYYTVTLEYDYFMYDPDRRQVILRQDYTDGQLATV